MSSISRQDLQCRSSSQALSSVIGTGQNHLITLVRDRLESTLGLDQVTGVARLMPDASFAWWMGSAFGSDICVEAYRALRADLCANAVKHPPIVLTRDGLSGYRGAYNRSARVIEISRSLAVAALDDPEAAWTLCAVLLEEFGHHLDTLLRVDYAPKACGEVPFPDAPLDEGARFGYALFHLRWDKVAEAPIAVFHHKGQPLEIKVGWGDYHGQFEGLLGLDEQLDDAADGIHEYFGAGKGPERPKNSFNHESIEDALEMAGYADRETRREIYFGNWLRDYSQAVAPLPRKAFSRKALTAMIDVLARKKFPALAHFKVTEARLGAYRWEEHLDNPSGLADDRKLEPALNAPPTARDLEVDPLSWMLRYVTSQPLSGASYMTGEISKAVGMSPGPEAFKCLGGALHTLEDFFAHSNFCELALCELGYDVYPWARPMSVQGRQAYPLVSGTFGGVDTAASILYEVADVIAAPKGKSSNAPGDKLVRIMVEDLTSHLGKELEAYLKLKELAGNVAAVPGAILKYVPGANYIARGQEWLRQQMLGLLGMCIKQIAAQIDDAQTRFLNNPEEGFPTHTQIAKDHDDHPLHALAARLAMLAAQDVAYELLMAWQRRAADPVAKVQRYLFHPARIRYGEQKRLMDVVKVWAAANTGVIVRLKKPAKMALTDHHEWSTMLSDARVWTRDMSPSFEASALALLAPDESLLGELV